jgi:hypothetical protein
MALEDFLGETSEIKIFDFLAENMDNSYNQSEISKFTGLSRTTVNKKVSEMIYNNILVINEMIGKMKNYQLADNEIVKMLIASSLTHSFKQAEIPLDEEEAKEKIRMDIGLSTFDEPIRYHTEQECDYVLMTDGDETPLMMLTKGRMIASLVSA